MADFDFEARLARLYAEPPALPDTEAFTARVTKRLDRGWALRGFGILAAGLVAGLIGAGQLVSSRVFDDLQLLTRDSTRALDSSYSSLTNRASDLMSLAGGGEVLWMAAGLAVLGLAFAVTRAVDQF